MKKCLPVLLAGLLSCFASAAPAESDENAWVARLSDKVSDESELKQKAEMSDFLLKLCVTDTDMKLASMFPEMSKQQRFDEMMEICRYQEDYYNIYNILLAANHFGQPMSEKQAWERLERNYRENSRAERNADIRAAIKSFLERNER